jgi:hypothetical protein
MDVLCIVEYRTGTRCRIELYALTLDRVDSRFKGLKLAADVIGEGFEEAKDIFPGLYC